MNNFIWIYQVAITLVLGIIAYFLKDMKKTIDDKIGENKKDLHEVKSVIGKVEDNFRQELDKMKEEHNQLKSDLPLVYVLRDDFIRAMGNVEKKLDKIYELLSMQRKEE